MPICSECKTGFNSGDECPQCNSTIIANTETETDVSGKNKLKSKKTVFFVISVLVAIGLITFMAVRFGKQSQMALFKKETVKKLDALIAALEQFGLGTIEVPSTFSTGSRVTKTTSEISHSQNIGMKLSAVEEQFEYVSWALMDELKADTEAAEVWKEEVKALLNEKRTAALKLAEGIKNQYGKYPPKHSFNMGGISFGSGYEYETLRIMNDELAFVTSRGEGFYLNKRINAINPDAWMNSILNLKPKEKSE